MSEVEVKKVDAQGRISLPVDWRKSFTGDSGEVMVVRVDDRLEVLPSNADLSEYVDSVDVDSEEWSDYHRLRKELGRGKYA